MGKYSLKEFEESDPDINMSMQDLDAIGELSARDVHRQTTPLRLQDMPADVLRHISSFNPASYTFSTTQRPPESFTVREQRADNYRGSWVRNPEDSLVGAYELMSGERTYGNLPYIRNPGLTTSGPGYGTQRGDRLGSIYDPIHTRIARPPRSDIDRKQLRYGGPRGQPDPMQTARSTIRSRDAEVAHVLDEGLKAALAKAPPSRNPTGYNRYHYQTRVNTMYDLLPGVIREGEKRKNNL